MSQYLKSPGYKKFLPTAALPEITLIFSRRRSLALQVKNDGEIVLRAPADCGEPQLSGFIKKHQKWLLDKHRQVLANAEQYPPRQFTAGELFYFLGRQYPLCFSGCETTVFFEKDRFIMPRIYVKNPSGAAKLLRDWFRREATDYICNRTAVLAAQNKLNFRQISINSARKRWGSCSRAGDLNFSWRLIMCPEKAIDYVIFHELAHLREMNHSRRFKDFLASLTGEYCEQEGFLRTEALKFQIF